MTTSIYIAGTEEQSGKSAVAVGVLASLAGRSGRVGVFRPVVRAGEPDALAEALLALLRRDTGHAGAPELPAGGAPAEARPQVVPAADVQAACGMTDDELHADPDAAMTRLVERFHEVARDVDTVLVVGSDYTGVATPVELSVNARLAANLGSRLLLVVPAMGRTPAQAATAAELAVGAVREEHAGVTDVVVNGVDPGSVEGVRTETAQRLAPLAVHVLPEAPLLRAPTLRDVMAACDGRLTQGDAALLDREVTSVIVAGMTMPHVLDRLSDGCVLVVPGDREDVVLASLMAHRSSTFPSLTGLVLNGGFPLPPQVERLLEGLQVRLPVIATDGDTMTAATQVGAARGRITASSTRKIETAIQLVDSAMLEAELSGAVAPLTPTVVTPLMFEHRLVERARDVGAHVVLPEGAEPRILTAAGLVLERRVARLTLLGDEGEVRSAAADLGVDLGDSEVVDPMRGPLRERFTEEYARLRAHKGVTLDMARDRVSDPACFGTLMVHTGLLDGMVAGSVTTTAHTIRPALEVVRTAPGVSVVSSVFLMCLADRVLVYGDCAVNVDPTAPQLADIALSSAVTAQQFGIEPRVAMLSYSTGESGSGAEVDKVREATGLLRERAPDLLVEGPIQYDAAVDPDVARTKLKDSAVAGRATVLIFPDLNTGNNTYKAVQRTASAVAIGPVLQGLNRPVNDLSRGATVRDIVNTIAITAIQARA
ncbi:MAG TPA: phosphate acetyltransferase [Dermatophilaceae bacterium]|nr:phosphate acetyltransferase [Dermatophilaceae bacterium]